MNLLLSGQKADASLALSMTSVGVQRDRAFSTGCVRKLMNHFVVKVSHGETFEFDQEMIGASNTRE